MSVSMNSRCLTALLGPFRISWPRLDCVDLRSLMSPSANVMVRKHLEFPLCLAKLEQGEIDPRVANATDVPELVPHLERGSSQLQGG